MRKAAKTDALQRIPGVGPSLAEDLRSLGISGVQDLCGRNPQQMYEQLSALAGCHVDRCVLYVFRCAVYFAEKERLAQPHHPELLKWWNWKDGGTALTHPDAFLAIPTPRNK